MDFNNLLRTVAKTRTGILANKEKLASRPLRKHQGELVVPKSMNQLLIKYSPRNSPILKQQKSKSKLEALATLSLILKNSVFKVWKEMSKIGKKSPRKPVSIKHSSICEAPFKNKFIKLKTHRNEKTCINLTVKIDKFKKVCSRSNTISKLEATIKLARIFKRKFIVVARTCFEDICLMAKQKKFIKKVKFLLKRLFKKIRTCLTSAVKLSITTTDCISVSPALKRSETCLVIQESSFNLPPSRNVFSPVNANRRYSMPGESDSQISVSGDLEYQDLELPNLSSLDLKTQSFEHNITDSINCIEIEYAKHASYANGKISLVDDSLVELEDESERIEDEISPILSPISFGQNKDNAYGNTCENSMISLFLRKGIKKSLVNSDDIPNTSESFSRAQKSPHHINSTSTTSISKTPQALKKIFTRGSKDTIPGNSFCLNSQSIEIIPSIKTTKCSNKESLKTTDMDYKGFYAQRESLMNSPKPQRWINTTNDRYAKEYDEIEIKSKADLIDFELISPILIKKKKTIEKNYETVRENALKSLTLKVLSSFVKNKKKVYKGLEILVRLFSTKHIDAFLILRNLANVN